MNRRRVTLTLLAVVLGCAALFGAPAAAQLDGEPDLILRSVPKGPIAFVNGEPVSSRDFIEMYKSELTRWAAMNPQTAVSDRVRVGIALSVERMLIERAILLQEAQRLGLTVSDAEVEEEWAEELEQLKRAMAREGETLTEADVLERAETTREDALRELRKVILIEKMRGRIMDEAGVTVSDEEVRGFFEENSQRFNQPEGLHIRQIFIAVPRGREAGNGTQDAARDRAEEALKRIRSGQSFDAVARLLSEGAMKDEGGDLGMRPVTTLPPFLVEAARQLGPGDISDLIESEFGYHIIQFVDSREGVAADPEQWREPIRQRLRRSKGEEAVERYTAKIMGDEEVVQEYFLPQLERQLAARPDLLAELQQVPE